MSFLLTTNLVNDNSKTYAKQIHPYGGKVYAEIIYQDSKTELDRRIDLWHCSMHNSFGKYWRKAPREQDYIDAHKWADEQLALLQKYGIQKLEKAECLREGKEYLR